MALECFDVEHAYFGCPQDLFGVSLSLEKGDFIVLYGKRNSGKTPLLKALSGFEKPNKGKVTLDGKDIFSVKGKDRNIVLTLERDGFLRLRSLYYNLNYPLKIRKVPKKEREAIVDDIIDKTFLNGALWKTGKMLQEPEYSKATVARALVREADYYLFDNPFRFLTVSQRREIFLSLIPLLLNLKGGVLYATDSIEEVVYLNKKTYILDGGKIIAGGTVSEFLKSQDDTVKCIFYDDLTKSFLKSYEVNNE